MLLKRCNITKRPARVSYRGIVGIAGISMESLFVEGGNRNGKFRS